MSTRKLSPAAVADLTRRRADGQSIRSPLPKLFGLTTVADATLPPNVVELRDRDGKVLARHELTT